MKLLILSDIHSNIYALEAIWAAERGVDRIYCAGDLVDYGPYPREVIAWIRDHQVAVVQGNHDAWVAANYRAGRLIDTLPEPERAWVHYNAARLDEVDIRFLESLPRALTFEADGIRYGMSHLYRDYEEIVSLHALTRFQSEVFADYSPHPIPRLIFGHTHRQAIRHLSDEVCWLNPGSVSYRRMDDPDQTAHYIVITDGVVSLRRISYDLGPLHRFVRQIQLSADEMRVARWFFGPREASSDS